MSQVVANDPAQKLQVLMEYAALARQAARYTRSKSHRKVSATNPIQRDVFLLAFR